MGKRAGCSALLQTFYSHIQTLYSPYIGWSGAESPGQAALMSQPLCLLQNERTNGIHVTDEPGSQVSGPGTTSRSHTESTHNCRRECRNGSIEWVSEACPPVCPCLLCGNCTPSPSLDLSLHQLSGSLPDFWPYCLECQLESKP